MSDPDFVTAVERTTYEAEIRRNRRRTALVMAGFVVLILLDRKSVV